MFWGKKALRFIWPAFRKVPDASLKPEDEWVPTHQFARIRWIHPRKTKKGNHVFLAAGVLSPVFTNHSLTP